MLGTGPPEGHPCGDSECTLGVLGGHQEADGWEGKQEGGSPGLWGPPLAEPGVPKAPSACYFWTEPRSE